jgi:hypothetical protein
MIDILAAAGWQTVAQRRLDLFPDFTPGPVYRLLAPLETRVEASRFWNASCELNLLDLTRV